MPRVPAWRFKEIQNIADSTVFRASFCPIGRMVLIAENEYLKLNSHIRLMVDPTMPLGTARKEIAVSDKKGVSGPITEAPCTFHEVAIYFNGDIGTKKNWDELTRALLRVLGEIIFFSDAAKRLVVVSDEAKFLDKFVENVMTSQPFAIRTVRPRFYLARLKDIIENEMRDSAPEMLPHLQRFLWSYLGPDGLMEYES